MTRLLMIYPFFLLVYAGWHLVRQPFRALPLPLLVASLIALVLCVANGLADHFFAPVGILLTPLVLTTAAALITSPRNTGHVLWKSVITSVLCCLNDAGIKLYGGGAHDLEGQGFINLFFFAGLLPAYALIISCLIRSTGIRISEKLVAAVTTPLIVFCYLYFFSNLGLGRFYESHIVY